MEREMLRLEHISKSFSGVKALTDIHRLGLRRDDVKVIHRINIVRQLLASKQAAKQQHYQQQRAN